MSQVEKEQSSNEFRDKMPLYSLKFIESLPASGAQPVTF